MTMNKFRCFFVPAFGDRNIFVGEPCETKDEAQRQLDAIATYTLYLHECKYMRDESNYGGIEELIDNEWIEIDEDDDE